MRFLRYVRVRIIRALHMVAWQAELRRRAWLYREAVDIENAAREKVGRFHD